MTAEALPKPRPDRLEALRRLKDGRLANRAIYIWTWVRADFRRWWIHTLNPPPLGTWWAARTPARIPDGSVHLTWTWRIDHWATGAPLAALSIVTFLAAAGLRWISAHPARRWTFLPLAVAALLWLLVA